MPLLLGNKENDIMQWRASRELVALLKESLALKWAGSSPAQMESSLVGFVAALEGELRQEERYLHELSGLNDAVDAASSLEELPPLQERYRDLIAAHFSRRQSVLALCELAGDRHDRILAKAVLLTQLRQATTGRTPAQPVFALLVSDAGGRGEQTLRYRNRYFLLLDQAGPDAAHLVGLLLPALTAAGVVKSEQQLWHGSLGDWQALWQPKAPGSEPRPFPMPLPFEAPPSHPQQAFEQQQSLETLLDLRFLQGDPSLAGQALESARQALQSECERDSFRQLSRRVLSLPLATGHFGRWRLQKAGEHRGELDVEEFALGPLVMTVRLLAWHSKIEARGTVARIQALLAHGLLDVELAERLLQAYRCFMQLKIQHEIDSDGNGGVGSGSGGSAGVGSDGDGSRESRSFCKPAEFDAAAEERVKSSVAALFSLQKIGYQRIVEQG